MASSASPHAARERSSAEGRDTGLLTGDLEAGGRWERVRRRCGGRLGRAWRLFAYGARPAPPTSHQGPIESPPEDPCERRIGICCSGGGIRSAAFNLGALQSLQPGGQLANATYLSAVSGGSYIAAAMTMVERDRPAVGPPAFAPRTPEEQYLRNRSDYMAPNGLGKLYLGYRLLLGFAFNAVFLMLPVVVVTILVSLWLYRDAGGQGIDIEAGWWWIVGGIAAASAAVALLGMVLRIGGVRMRQLSETWSTRLLMAAAVAGWLLLGLPAAADLDRLELEAIPAFAGSGGLLAGIAAAVRNALVKPGEAIGSGVKAATWAKKLGRGTRTTLVYTAATVAGPLLVAGVMLVTASLVVRDDGTTTAWIVAGGCAAAFLVVYAIGDMTSWSLHPFYKRRLATAFALRRVRDGDGAAYAEEREYDRLVPLSQTVVAERPWPTLLVCAAANVSDPGSTPPGRRVTSVTFSPHAIGGPLVGGVPATTFEHAFDGDGKRARDVTLLAAVAMSGAAIAPSMGKMSRRSLTFLMALANIRLGVWVPNPGWVARSSSGGRRAFGRARPIHLFRELLGRNRVDGRYLFVTDGGHYENLGLVELLRRGCTDVYCFDASGGDPMCQLGDAIALARSELGVEIDIDPSELDAVEGGAKDAVRGRIVYSNGSVGTLVYATNVVTDGSPWDVKAYRQDDPDFPRNSTADQLYTDQRFESYRTLGLLAGRNAIALMDARPSA
ncbi:MAG: hypothetical protein WEB79_04325 [Thermoleophilaceae bacterium]